MHKFELDMNWFEEHHTRKQGDKAYLIEPDKMLTDIDLTFQLHIYSLILRLKRRRGLNNSGVREIETDITRLI